MVMWHVFIFLSSLVLQNSWPCLQQHVRRFAGKPAGSLQDAGELQMPSRLFPRQKTKQKEKKIQHLELEHKTHRIVSWMTNRTQNPKHGEISYFCQQTCILFFQIYTDRKNSAQINKKQKFYPSRLAKNVLSPCQTSALALPNMEISPIQDLIWNWSSTCRSISIPRNINPQSDQPKYLSPFYHQKTHSQENISGTMWHSYPPSKTFLVCHLYIRPTAGQLGIHLPNRLFRWILPAPGHLRPVGYKLYVDQGPQLLTSFIHPTDAKHDSYIIQIFILIDTSF